LIESGRTYQTASTIPEQWTQKPALSEQPQPAVQQSFTFDQAECLICLDRNISSVTVMEHHPMASTFIMNNPTGVVTWTPHVIY